MWEDIEAQTFVGPAQEEQPSMWKTFDGWIVDIFSLINKERLQNVPVLYYMDKDGIMNVAPGYATSGKAKCSVWRILLS
eukprot:645223-Ditylum_brightwellii.AAC.1